MASTPAKSQLKAKAPSTSKPPQRPAVVKSMAEMSRLMQSRVTPTAKSPSK